eukprot:3165584-Rhodomonas_salina.2
MPEALSAAAAAAAAGSRKQHCAALRQPQASHPRTWAAGILGWYLDPSLSPAGTSARLSLTAARPTSVPCATCRESTG